MDCYDNYGIDSLSYGVAVERTIYEEYWNNNYSNLDCWLWINLCDWAKAIQIPPDVTVEIEDIDRFAELLQDVVIYNIHPFPLFYFGQGVTYTVVFKDGTETKISACNPIVTINGVRYKCKYEPCEALNEFGNSFIDWLNEKPDNTEEDSSKGLELITDSFWDDVSKVIYYDFDETVYETVEKETIEEISKIVSEMTYTEIDNPEIEGWYLFEVHKGNKRHSLAVSYDIICYDGEFYKVTEVIANTLCELIKQAHQS